MTSEIAVMNQRAIALAADSAVTLIDGGRIIVRNDQKKLFNLAEGMPVGVMFFGMADIMGHPWDMLVEHYRKTVPTGALPRLGDHGEDFLAKLDGLESFFPPARQKDDYRRLFASVLRFVFRLAHYFYEMGAPGPDEALLHQAIALVHERYHRHADGKPRRDLPCFPEGFAERVRRDYSDVADGIIAYSFAAFPLSQAARDQLNEIAVLCVVKDLFLEDVTGLVFAGYGADDHYPVIATYHVSAVVGGIVKRALADEIRIDGQSHAAIAVYAESDATYAFLRGIERELESEIVGRTQGLACELVDRVVDSVTGVDPVQREQVRRQFQGEAIPAALDRWYDGISAFQQEAYVNPMLAVLEISTRQELAETAEELVALNILKKRMTGQSQTVGGAIDVAIISRESGFSWWKRQGG